MNEQQQVSRRQSASGPGDRVASTRDIAIYFREDCRTLRDSLQLEMVVAQYEVQISDVVNTSGIAVGAAVRAGVIPELEGHGDPLSHAILRGLAHLVPGEGAELSAAAAARLDERGVGLPPQFADVGAARALGAWRTPAEAGEYMLVAEFEHSLGGGHSVGFFVQARRGGVVKHLGLMGPMRELPHNELFHPATMKAIGIARAGTLMRELLERSFGPLLDQTDDFRALIAAARARSMETPG